MPFAWSEVGQWCCDRCCDKSDYERERMIEVFKLNRSYKELIERLELEKIDGEITVVRREIAEVHKRCEQYRCV